MTMDELERTLLVKPEVFIYKIPPRSSAKGYRAADWKLDAPDWTVRLRCVVKGSLCEIRLEDRNSGELFAACPVEHYPGTSVEAVTDSSRYFVICVQGSGNKAYLGMGFTDRSDSFDLNVTLQDHFKQLKKEDQFSREAVEPPKPNLDLAFKDGETIRIKINTNKPAGATSRPRGGSKGTLGPLPPPPTGSGGGGGGLCRIPASASNDRIPASASNDLLVDFATPTPAAVPVAQPPTSVPSSFSDFDDDFGAFESTKAPSSQTVRSSGNWSSFE